jgi:hypothetical protein
LSPEKPIFVFESSRVSIDLTNSELGRELLKNPKGDLPIDTWRQYVVNHIRSSDPEKPQAEVLCWCDEPYRSTLDPQTALDDAFLILVDLLFRSPKRSDNELLKGIWKALSVLHQAHSSGRKRGQPPSMRPEAVRAYVIRKFNPLPKKPKESRVSFAELADLLFLENDTCPRTIRDEDGELKLCDLNAHRYDSPCVKALRTAVDHLLSAMKLAGIPK